MKIILSPAAAFADDTPPIVSGDTITYRSEQYDLSQLPDGAEVDAELPFIGKIKRVNGQVGTIDESLIQLTAIGRWF